MGMTESLKDLVKDHNFKDHPVLAAYRAKLEQIKLLVSELNNFYV